MGKSKNSFHFTVKDFSFWAPGVESPERYQAWAKGEMGSVEENSPACKFLPAMFRRRLSRLSKIAFTVMQKHMDTPDLPTVFASRHGELFTTAKLLEDLLEEESLSPTRFSLSVHNSASGLFSIASKNKAPSVALANGYDTFCSALLEATAILHRNPQQDVLLVIYDEYADHAFKDFLKEDYSYGLSLLLSSSAEGTKISGQRKAHEQGLADDKSIQALDFFKWFLSEEQSCSISGNHCSWNWSKN